MVVKYLFSPSIANMAAAGMAIKGEMVFCCAFAPECCVVFLFIRCEAEIESFSARPAVSDDTAEGKDTPHFIW